jgi:intein/homing endonuclease
MARAIVRPVLTPKDREQFVTAGPDGDRALSKRIHDRMLRTSCAFFAQEMLSEPFIVGKHHAEWDKLAYENKRLCILAARDHGKCSRGDDLLLAADGARVRVDQWSGGELIAWDELRREFTTAYSPPVIRNGKRPVVEVRTRTGRVLVLTEKHPLLTWDGWVPAGNLRLGQQIAVAYTLPVGLGKIPLPSAWLLGVLVGDGGLTGTGVEVTIADLGMQDQVRKEVGARGWVLSKRALPISFGISSGGQGGRGPKERTPTRWLKQLGAWGGAAEKKVPEAVFRAPDVDIAEFIAGYLDSDGTVNSHGGGAVEFYSVSRQLLDGVQHLLTRLGVLSVLLRKLGKYKGEDHHSWRLTVRGKDILRLAEVVRPRGAKGPRLLEEASVQRGRGRASGACVDRFPSNALCLLEKSDGWHRAHGGARRVKKYRPTREKMRRLAEQEGNKELKAWVDAPVFWDEVTAISSAGECETWAVSVPGFHTYVSNDVVNHNSHFWSFAYPIWRAYNHRPGQTKGRHSIFIFSATAAQAEIILENIRTELETNPKLSHLVPTRKTLGWSSRDLRLANGYWIRARGYGTKVRGGHPQDIVVDDGLNDETIYSPTVRQKQIDYFLSAIVNMVHPKGRIIVVGTPFTVDDLYGVLAENPAYTFRAYQALTQDGLALFPERYSLADLAAKKIEIGPIRFAREFLCQALHDDMSLFPHRLFIGDPVEQPLVKLGMPLAFWMEAGITSVYTGVDFALSANVGADFTVIFTIGLDGVGNRWILDIRRFHGMPYQEQKSQIIEVGRLYQPGLIVCEANQAQRIFGDTLITETDLPILCYTTGVEKHALDKGVPGLRILFENRKYRIPRGDARSVELTNQWAHELTAFTWHEGKLASLTGHDDLPMANWLCEVGIGRGAFTFSMGLDTMPDPAKVAKKLTVQQAVQQAAGKLVGPAGAGPVGTVLPGPVVLERPPVPAGPPPPPVQPRSAWQVGQSFSRAGLGPAQPAGEVELGPLGFPILPGEK